MLDNIYNRNIIAKLISIKICQDSHDKFTIKSTYNNKILYEMHMNTVIEETFHCQECRDGVHILLNKGQSFKS